MKIFASHHSHLAILDKAFGSIECLQSKRASRRNVFVAPAPLKYGEVLAVPLGL